MEDPVEQARRLQEAVRERLKRRRLAGPAEDGVPSPGSAEPCDPETPRPAASENIAAAADDAADNPPAARPPLPEDEAECRDAAEDLVLWYVAERSEALPQDSAFLLRRLREARPEVDELLSRAGLRSVEPALRALAAAGFACVESTQVGRGPRLMAMTSEPAAAFAELASRSRSSASPYRRHVLRELLGRSRAPSEAPAVRPPSDAPDAPAAALPTALFLSRSTREARPSSELEKLLGHSTFKEREASRAGVEIAELLNARSVKEREALAKLRSRGGGGTGIVQEYCPHLTREECVRKQMEEERAGAGPSDRSHGRSYAACTKIHFRKLLYPHTDPALGDCSYLDTCRHVRSCRFVHYGVDPAENDAGVPPPSAAPGAPIGVARPAQWVNADVRSFPWESVGKFGVIMADPPWDIHMDLPYGTLTDDEMRSIRLQSLCDHGLLFLWVTGRAMELARECMQIWGYKRVDEIIWVKTNQLQRIIRTGRTGHWLNHSKEHCLVGVKGNPPIHRNIDCDVIVAEVRETSRKPDEIYSMIERAYPDCPKIEIFGRMHNVRPGWLTVGNQLEGDHIEEPHLREALAGVLQANVHAAGGRGAGWPPAPSGGGGHRVRAAAAQGPRRARPPPPNPGAGLLGRAPSWSGGAPPHPPPYY